MEVASDEPPMTLDQRTRLSRLQLKLQISPIDEIFSVQGDRVASEKAIRKFMENLLTDLRHRFPTEPIPEPCQWNLNLNGRAIKLNEWDVCDVAKGVVQVMRLEHPSPPWISSEVGRVFRDGVMNVTAEEFSLSGSPLIQLPSSSYLLLSIRMYRRSKKGKTLTYVQDVDILAPRSLTVSTFLAKMDAHWSAKTLLGVYEGNSLNKDIATKPVGAFVPPWDQLLSATGWSHLTILQFELK